MSIKKNREYHSITHSKNLNKLTQMVKLSIDYAISQGLMSKSIKVNSIRSLQNGLNKHALQISLWKKMILWKAKMIVDYRLIFKNIQDMLLSLGNGWFIYLKLRIH